MCFFQRLKKLSDDEDKIKKEKQKKYRDQKKETQELLKKLKVKLKKLPKSAKDTPKDEATKGKYTDLAKVSTRCITVNLTLSKTTPISKYVVGREASNLRD